MACIGKGCVLDIRYPVTRYLYRPASVPLARAIAGTAVTPAQVTWTGVVLLAAGAVLFGFGHYLPGGVLTLVGAVIDCVDGDLARITGRSSRSGAFLDSVLDRWTDSAAVLGLALSDPEHLGAIGALALAASLVTPYTRARALSLGVDTPDGVGGRDARLLVLGGTAIAGFVFWGLVAVAALGVLTSIHRLVLAERMLSRLDRAERRPKEDPSTRL